MRMWIMESLKYLSNRWISISKEVDNLHKAYLKQRIFCFDNMRIGNLIWQSL